jgi:hypothetical protein
MLLHYAESKFTFIIQGYGTISSNQSITIYSRKTTIKFMCRCYILGATASGGTKQAWHVPDAVCTVLELLMMGGETARNM